MGSPKIEAFLVLEATVARTVTASWDPIARQAIKAISTALAANRFDEAYDIAERITLANVVEQQRRRLEELATSALLFGASRLVDLQSTALMSGKPLPSLVDMALNQLVAMIEEDAADNVRAATVKIIGRAEESFKHGQLAVEKAEFDLADALNAAVLGTGRGLIDVGANLTTSRLVSFGFLDQAVELQIDTYQVSEILDGRHCAVCEIMHGKTFEVRHEHARVERVLQILDPAELKTAAPWPRQDKESLQILRGMSTSDMQNAGFGSPPYHPLCRGVLAPAGSITEIVSVQEPEELGVIKPTVSGVEHRMPLQPTSTLPKKPISPVPPTSVLDEGPVSVKPENLGPEFKIPVFDADKEQLLTLANNLQSMNLREAVLSAIANNDLEEARKLIQQSLGT